MNNSFISLFSGFIFIQGLPVGRETGHARKLPRQYIYSQHLLQLKKHAWTDWEFHIFVQQSHTPIQLHTVKNPTWLTHPLKKSFISLSLQKHNLTNWRILRDLLILWRRDSFPYPYKNITSLTEEPIPILAFSYVLWCVITSRNQHFFKRRYLLFPLICKWKYIWWRSWKHEPSKFFPRV